MASDSGPGSARRRQSLVLGLLRACRDVETKYLVRTLVQNLRVGANWRSVLPPLAKAAVMHRCGAQLERLHNEFVHFSIPAAASHPGSQPHTWRSTSRPSTTGQITAEETTMPDEQ